MKKIIITGANGQLGRSVIKYYENCSEIELIKTDVDELDISKLDKVLDLVTKTEPYAIINCAAYTLVDKCETEVDLAYKINAIGPRNLAIAANKVNAKIVHISTDYVFQGNGHKPYTEFDHTMPTSVYGSSKLAGEEFVKNMSSKYFIVRTAWLYGEGKNFIKTMLNLGENNPKIRVVSDQFGTPTSTKELTKIIDKLLFTENYGVYHGTCEGICTWADFAEKIFELSKKNVIVERIKTIEYPTPAKRPEYSVLDNYMMKLIFDYEAAQWEFALEEYMKEMSLI